MNKCYDYAPSGGQYVDISDKLARTCALSSQILPSPNESNGKSSGSKQFLKFGWKKAARVLPLSTFHHPILAWKIASPRHPTFGPSVGWKPRAHPERFKSWCGTTHHPSARGPKCVDSKKIDMPIVVAIRIHYGHCNKYDLWPSPPSFFRAHSSILTVSIC